MSLGYEGYAQLIDEDDEIAIYYYSGADWNDSKYDRNSTFIYDGQLLIFKSSLEEPEVNEKIRKMPSHKKKLVKKRITHMVNIDKKVSDGLIEIVPSKTDFSRWGKKANYLAYGLLNKIFEMYQEESKIPEHACFFQ